MDEIKIDDDGLVPVTIKGCRIEIDIYAVYLQLDDMDAKVREEFAQESVARQQHEYLSLVVAFMGTLGFPVPISEKAADAFDQAINKVALDLGKAPAAVPTPG